MGLWAGSNPFIQEPVNGSAAKREMAIARRIARDQAEFNKRGSGILSSVSSEANKPIRKAAIRGREQREQQQIFADAAAGMKAEQIAERQVRRTEMKLRAKVFAEKVGKSKDLVQQEIGRLHGIATDHQQVDFSSEQRMLGQMFGQGEKVWGTNNEPVRINHDLNPSQADPWDETGSMFGFGGHSERSGLF